MNAITPISRGLAPFEGRLTGITNDVRAAAVGELERLGLPTQKVEAWHYTNLRALSGHAFAAPGTVDEGKVTAALAALFGDTEALAKLPRLVLVNGRLSAVHSTTQLPDGVSCTSFATTQDFGTQSAPDREAMVALNTALAEDGVCLSVGAGVKAGALLLISVAGSGDEDTSFHPRHAVALGEGASLTLIELAVSVENAGPAMYFHNPVLSCDVAEDAHLTHMKVQEEAENAVHLATVYADVEPRGSYDSFTLGLGALLARHEVHAALRGSHASVHVNGAQILGARQVGDITSVILHGAPDGVSRQTVRNVLTDHARAVFQGKVLVERIAQKTDGYQMNQALLLSPNAEIDAKPELEIYADDVKCSHGATVGALDEDQLFYLRARGIPDDQARRMLVEAFLTETVELVQDEAVRTFLMQRVERALKARVSAGEKAA
ncbi:Fe-S cluster assembly protein SufD [Acetobacter estunensis]|uniref:Fe-S cluster assembly protein SufD n=1 Tax=Acetobacter estunensis TaxID=104097 RepID=UPI001C2D352C|nr:Fe-S cluster assembly protein SufD [Acetobacter estunensis]MBV1836525.1 Fe-S cluster assembly protein SufD [Acetobacter estunensis]